MIVNRLLLTAAGVAALATLVLLPAAAAAADTDATPAVDIQLPAGITTQTLASADPGTLTLAGCTPGGSATVQVALEFELGGETSPSSTVPISLSPSLAVSADGEAAFPLAPVSLWLANHEPAEGFRIVIKARCNPDGPWTSRTITAAGTGLGAGIPSTPASPEPEPAPAPGDALAETGTNDAALFAAGTAGLLAILGGCLAAGSARRRRRLVQ